LDHLVPADDGSDLHVSDGRNRRDTQIHSIAINKFELSKTLPGNNARRKQDIGGLCAN
jgi:hypothetical protein